MSIDAACACGKRFRVKDEYAGRKGKCPACGNPVIIPKPVVKPAEPVGWDDLEALETSGSVQEDEGIAMAQPERRAAAASPAVPQTRQKACPACGSTISSFALICEHCGANVKTGAKGGKKSTYASTRGGSSDLAEPLSGLDWAMIILCPGIGMIVGIIRLVQGRSSGGKLLGFSFLATVIFGAIKVAMLSAVHQ
jgi:hypothetical protein